MRISKHRFITLLILASALFAAGHAFCYFNLSLTGEGFRLNAMSSYSAVSGGAFLQPFYFRIRGAAISPFLVGALTFVSLFLSAVLCAEIFSFETVPQLFLLAASLMLSPSLLSLNASALGTAEVPWISLLFVTGGTAFLLQEQWMRRLIGVFLITGGLGLYPANGSFLIGLLLLLLLNAVLNGGKPFGRLSWLLFGTLSALILYAAGFLIVSRMLGLDIEASFYWADGGRGWGLLYPLRAMLLPVSAYPFVHIALMLLFLGAGVFAAARKTVTALPILTAALLCPGLPVFGNAAPPQFLPSALIIPLAVLLCLKAYFSSRRFRLGLALSAVISLGLIVFSNQVYFKLCLNFDTTLSLMTRIISRAESIPDFMPGETPVLFAGTPEDSVYSQQRPGFEHLNVMEAARYHTSLQDPSQLTYYFWETLGYPFELLSDYDREVFLDTHDISAVPPYPAQGSLSMTDGVLVIRLSEDR